jgi:hypothetical protein
MIKAQAKANMQRTVNMVDAEQEYKKFGHKCWATLT